MVEHLYNLWIILEHTAVANDRYTEISIVLESRNYACLNALAVYGITEQKLLTVWALKSPSISVNSEVSTSSTQIGLLRTPTSFTEGHSSTQTYGQDNHDNMYNSTKLPDILDIIIKFQFVCVIL